MDKKTIYNNIVLEDEEAIEQTVKLREFCEACKLSLLYGDIEGSITLRSRLVNRPGLLLAGFEDYFGNDRVQIIGYAEYCYFEKQNYEAQVTMLKRLFSKQIPCCIFARGIVPNQIIGEMSKKYKVPILASKSTTTALNSTVATYLDSLLAPSISYHGTLLNVSGIGVLLTGDSGMGKSETALELIYRGHRLVADDAVIIQRINSELVGKSPDTIKFLMEVRGIGIIDVGSLYGIGAVLDNQDINLILHLTHCSDNVEIDRLGDREETENILGIEIPKMTIPVMPGRNLAIIVEVAVRHHRMKKTGYNPLEQLIERSALES